MAKRSGGSVKANQTAEQLGRLLGQVAARVDSWKKQRNELRTDLAKIVSTANRLIEDLGGAGRQAGRQAAGAVNRAGRNVSAIARARMAAAARRRWARYRADKAKATAAK
jgi:hypothetical protein